MLLSCLASMQNFNVIRKLVDSVEQKLFRGREAIGYLTFVLVLDIVASRARYVQLGDTVSQHKVVEQR